MVEPCDVPKADALMYLKDVTPLWRAFWFHMHLMAKNLEEFGAGLGGITDEVFAYHVSGQKNDLSRWVREVIGDAALAKELEGVTTQSQAAKMVTARLAELRRAAA